MASKDTTPKTPLDGANLHESVTLPYRNAQSEGFNRRKRIMTAKGQEFVERLKFNKIKGESKELEALLNNVDLNWLDEDANSLRNSRQEIEKYRCCLETALEQYLTISSDLSKQENNELIQRCKMLNYQALEFRRKLGDRVFELEREETRSQRSKVTRASKYSGNTKSVKSSSSQRSLEEIKIKLARGEVDMKFSRLRAEVELDIQQKKLEFEQLEKLKYLEALRAEKNVLEEIEIKSSVSMLTEENVIHLNDKQSSKERVENYLLTFNEPAREAKTMLHSNPQYSMIDTCDDTRDNNANHVKHDVTPNDDSSSRNIRIDSINVNNGDTCSGNDAHNSLRDEMKNTGSPLPDPPLHTGSPSFAAPLHTGSPKIEADISPQFYKGTPALPDHPRIQTERPQESSREFEQPCQRSKPIYSSTPMTSLPSCSLPFIQEIGSVIAEGMQASKLPPPQLRVFEGNPLEWPTWKAAFETVVEKRTTTDSERILYLQQYLSGEPRKIIEGYQFVPSPTAYQEAKQKLEKRFGNSSVVADAFRHKLESWPRIPPRDGKALREFADFLKTCELAMSSIEDLKTLNTQYGNKQLLKVLPSWMLPKWGTRVRDFQLKYGESKFPPIDEFVRFVSSTADIQCLPVLSGLEVSKPQQRVDVRAKPRYNPTRNVGTTLATKVESSQPSKNLECLWCKADHHLNNCSNFLREEHRTKFIIRKGLCLRCLCHGHMAKENKCVQPPPCTKCTEQHPTCLHVAREEKTQSEIGSSNPDAAATKCTSVCKLKGQQDGQDQCLVVPVWISSDVNPAEEILTYALLDSQSNATFITESLRETMNIDGVNSHLLLSTMHEENELIECKKIKGLVIKDFQRSTTVPLPNTYTRQHVPCKPSQIPKPSVARQWSHLERIADEIMPFKDDVEVGLLIGTNCPKAIKPREVIPGSDDDPYAVRTDLGWG